MGYIFTLVYNMAAVFKSTSHHPAPRCALELAVQSLGIRTDSAQVISMAEGLYYQEPA